MSNYKISDKQKLNIIAERQNGKSIKELAKTYKVSRQTISTILNDTQTLQNLTQTLQDEKEEVILKWSAYWNSQSKIGQEISTKAFELLKAKIEKANAKDLVLLLKEFKNLFDVKSEALNDSANGPVVQIIVKDTSKAEEYE